MLGLLAAGAALAQDWDRIEFQATELAGGITWLRGAGGNVVLCVGDDGPLLVDADYAQMSEKLIAQAVAIGGHQPALLINTHWHFDHCGGNEALRRAGCRAIAHENVRRRLAAGQHIDLIDHDEPPAAPEALPEITFTDSLTLHWNDQTVVVWNPKNAHSDGDAVVRFVEGNVIHTGDIVFFCGYPFIDVSSGGTIDGMIAAVQAILAKCDEQTQIVPGHGPVTDKEGLTEYLGMLQGVRKAVAGEIRTGKSLAEIKAGAATAELDEKYGQTMFPPDLFREMVYLTLDEK
jgi:glyoxylase-like metal-dependent hydrolase (beta-lactamase superfamily II)